MGYTLVTLQDRDGSFVGYIEQVPGTMVRGASEQEIRERIRPALERAIERIAAENEAIFAGLKELGRGSLDDDPPAEPLPS